MVFGMDDFSQTIELPQGVSAKLENGSLSLSGKCGSVQRKFDSLGLKLELQDAKLKIAASSRAQLNTTAAHIQNMLRGVQEGFSARMRVVYSHFPIALEVKGSTLVIKNFLGEKKPRTCRIVGQTKVQTAGRELTISGPDKEDVGQSVANIRSATRIRERDSRIFQDGIYPLEE
jgi:large subunit ribosomal protein L6